MTAEQDPGRFDPVVDPPGDDWIDGSAAPFRLLVDSLAVCTPVLLDSTDGHPTDDRRSGMYVEQIRIDLPFELNVMTADAGAVRLGGSPPTQYTRTTVLPVFHQLTMTVRSKRHDG